MLALCLALLLTTPDEHLVRAERAIKELEFETAVFEAMTAATATGATDAQRVRAHLLAGVARRIIGDQADARLDFRFVLLRDPSVTLPKETSPKVLFFFESVRQEIDAEQAAQMDAVRKLQRANPTAAVSPPAPPEPVVPEARPVPPMGMVLIAAGGALALAGGAAAAYAEVSLGAPHVFEERQGLQVVGLSALAVLGVGAVAGVAGAVVVAGVAP